MGYRIGIFIALVTLVVLSSSKLEALHTLGLANTGHEDVACQDCHTPAPGTARQQLQANLRYWLGLRVSPVDFQHKEVTNADCIACHDKPKDFHPSHRFNEPRFAKVRASIQPQYCISCHREHTGVRVTIVPTFCVHCHEDLTVKKDPINIPHKELVAADNWESCMTCHDFHGNHVMKVKTVVEDALPLSRVIEYFNGSLSPYSSKRLYLAKDKKHD